MNENFGSGETGKDSFFHLVADGVRRLQSLLSIEIKMQLNKLNGTSLTGFQIMKTAHTGAGQSLRGGAEGN